MTDPQHHDPAEPELAMLQQNADTEPGLPPVAVRHDGPVYTQAQPARSGPAFAVSLTNTADARVVGADPRRSRVTLVGSAAWFYLSRKAGGRVPIPANVVVALTHADEIWARSQGGDFDLGVIVENYAD